MSVVYSLMGWFQAVKDVSTMQAGVRTISSIWWKQNDDTR